MIKARGTNGMAVVTFTLDAGVNAIRAAVCGEFNGWSEEATQMRRNGDGGFTATVELEPGRAYRFRYLLDGERWENDWAADAYVPNAFGADDSLVDVTALAEDVPPAAKKKTPAAPKAASATQAAPAKKAAKKEAATKAAPAKKTSAAKKTGKKPAG